MCHLVIPTHKTSLRNNNIIKKSLGESIELLKNNVKKEHTLVLIFSLLIETLLNADGSTLK